MNKIWVFVQFENNLTQTRQTCALVCAFISATIIKCFQLAGLINTGILPHLQQLPPSLSLASYSNYLRAIHLNEMAATTQLKCIPCNPFIQPCQACPSLAVISYAPTLNPIYQ